jgi:hypothetical protein
VVKASRDGRCKPAYSMAIPGEPAPGPDRRAEPGALPDRPGVTFADRTMRGLQAGSFRWSAAKPKTTSAGVPVTISPVILVTPGLTPARRDAG